MFQYSCLNPISEVGLRNFDENYGRTENMEEADAVLVRSAKMSGSQQYSSGTVCGAWNCSV